MFLFFSDKPILKGIGLWLYEYHLPDRNIFRDVKNILGDIPVIIVDGGANDGFYSLFFRHYFPLSTIYCFEPNTSVQLLPQVKKDKHIHMFNLALGDKNENQTMYVYEDKNLSKSSSISKPLNEDRKMKTITIPVTTLDTWSKEQRIEQIDVLKLDLEGYDLYALQGATSLLLNVKVIVVEVHFMRRYVDTPTFFDINEFLSNHGFYFFNIYDIGIDDVGKITGGNAVFVHL